MTIDQRCGTYLHVGDTCRVSESFEGYIEVVKRQLRLDTEGVDRVEEAKTCSGLRVRCCGGEQATAHELLDTVSVNGSKVTSTK